MRLIHQTALWLQLLLLVSGLSGSLRPWEVIADQSAGEADDQPGSAPALVVTDCPAEFVLTLLKNSRQLQQAGASREGGRSDSSNSQAQSPAALPIWPPPALKQGLSCTMELSQLSVALPGTNQVCTVLSITNNLLSILYSWQLVWASKGLTPSSAAGAVLLNSTGSVDSTVQLINPSANSSIAARGGSVDMLVQLGLTPSQQTAPKAPPPPPPSPPPPAPQPDSKGSASNRPRSAPKPAGGVVKPAVESVYLNGLQCTRLPLARPALGSFGGAEGLYLDDCGTVEWGVSENGTFLSAPGQESLGSLGSWELMNLTSSGNISTLNQSVAVGAVMAAVWQLSCVSQLCCGLQVVPSSVVSLGNGTDAANSTEPPVLATDGPTPAKELNSTPSSPAPSNITPEPQPVQTGGSDKTAGLVAGLVVAGVVVACMGAMLVVLVLRHRSNKLIQEKMQAQQGLVRHDSGASTGSGGTAGGTASLASLASTEWQQQQQLYTCTTAVAGRPPVPWLRGGPPQVLPSYHTAPPHLINAAAAAAAAELSASGGVWRAGSWQGPDAYVADGAPLTRASSSPSPLLRTTTASTATSSQPTRPELPLPGSSNPSSPSMALLHLPPTGPSRSNSHASPFGASTAGAGGTASGAFGVQSAASTSGASLTSTWGALRHIMGSGKVPAPKSSTLASSSSIGLTRHGSQAAMYETNDGTLPNALSAAAALAAATQGEQLALGYYRPPLQLIQEAAPLAGSGSAQALGQQQLQLLNSAGASTYLLGAGREVGSMAVSRRISPILSVHHDDDASSATSTDSMTPAAWHLTDRQMLEDTPGWLNIDFASEVRLEKKLGEGGFGQVFRARWRDEVIAAKLVPFMSLVAQQHHSTGLSLVSAAPEAAAAAAAAAAGQQAQAWAGSHNGSAASQLSSMRLGVQFSSASLRAIKVEIRVLSQLSHPNIVSFKGACLAPPHICILEELAEGGSLHSRLYSRSSANKAQQQQRQHQAPLPANAASSSSSSPSPPQPRPRKAGTGGSSSRPPPLTVAEVLHIALDVSRAMVYLHTLAPQVVHRDLKPQNVLLDLQGRAKVCDFGISKMKDASLAASSTRLQAGTPAYMAPEQFEGCSVTDKVDVFAFAVMLWECFEQQQPWKELSPMQIIYSVGLQKERLQRPARCPDALWQLIEACWAQDPRDRPSFADTMQKLQEIQRQLTDTQQECSSSETSSPDQHFGRKSTVQQQQHQQPPPQHQQPEERTVEGTPDHLQQQQQQVGEKLPAQAAAASPQGQPVEGSEEVDAHVAVVC